MSHEKSSLKSSELSEPLIVSSNSYHNNFIDTHKSGGTESFRTDYNKKSVRSIAYTLDFEDMIRFKSNIKRNICLFFTLLMLLILQRPFTDNFMNFENDYIVFLQKHIQIISPNNIFSLLINALNTFPILILTHIFVTMFYLSKNPLTAVKVMLFEFNSLMLISILEIVMADPRPFWNNSEIQAGFCETSYPYPSSHVFAYYFVLTYGTFVYFPSNEQKLSDKIWSWVAYIGVGLILYLEVLAGLIYNFQLLFSIFYTILITYGAIYFDKTFTTLIEKSTIEVQSAKRYTVFWLIFILGIWSLATTIYSTAPVYSNVDWYENLFACFDQHGIKEHYDTLSFTYLLGPWRSYTKTVAGFVWLGIIFGVAKTFRDFDGKIWYKRNFKKRVYMAAVANICILPFWVLDIYMNKYIGLMTVYSAANYLFTIVQAVFLGFILFGCLPYGVFKRFGWTTRVLEKLDSLN